MSSLQHFSKHFLCDSFQFEYNGTYELILNNLPKKVLCVSWSYIILFIKFVDTFYFVFIRKCMCELISIKYQAFQFGK